MILNSKPLVLLGCVLILAVACGDSVQIADPPNSDTEKPAEVPTPGSTSVGTHGTAPDPFAPAEVPVPMAGSGTGAREVFYRGVVNIDPAIKLPSTYALFISAGFPPRGRPPVLSIKLSDAPKFPVSFELSSKDIAFGSTVVDPELPLVLYMSLSESGMVAMPGQTPRGLYINSPVSEPIKPGTMDVALTLKESR